MIPSIVFRIIAVFAFLSFAACMAGAEKSIPRFHKSQLTDEQLTACAAFKAKAGQMRRTECERIRSIFLICPTISDAKGINFNYEHPSFIMTRDDVIGLLGKPDGSSEDSISYNNGENGQEVSVLGVEFRSGHVIFASIVSTKS